MANSLYRCKARFWLKPAGWSYAIRFDPNEILAMEISYSTPNPGQAAGYRVGYPLYENTSSITVDVKDRYWLKAGWLGLESAQRIQAIPEISIPNEVRTELSELTAGFADNTDLVNFIENAVFGTLIAELSYAYAGIERFVSQKYFFRHKSMKNKFGGTKHSALTFTGDSLYRSVLSQTRENFAIRQGTPLDVYTLQQLKYVSSQFTNGTAIDNFGKVNLDSRSLPITSLPYDLRTNGSVPATTMENFSADSGIRFIDKPTDPFTIDIVTDTPSRRTVFFLGKGLFEEMQVSAESEMSGTNVIRNFADRYSSSAGANRDTYVASAARDVGGDLSSAASAEQGTTSFLQNVDTDIVDPDTAGRGADAAAGFVKATIPLDTNSISIDYELNSWMERRAGLDTVNELIEDGSIVSRESAHAAADTPPSAAGSAIPSWYGGTVIQRENNDDLGDGVIVIRTNAIIATANGELELYEYYAHCIDHVPLNTVLNPGDTVATVSNKSRSNSIGEEHIHFSFYTLSVGASKVFINPATVAKFAILKSDRVRPDQQSVAEAEQGNSGNVYSESEALLRIVLAEARTTGKLGMALVSRVILNRACAIKNLGANFLTNGSSQLYDIITAQNQFEPTWSSNNNWNDAFRKATDLQIQTAKEAINLSQNPSQLLAELQTNGESEARATELVLSTFFAARSGIIADSVRQVVNFRQRGGTFDDHFFGIAKNVELNASGLLCGSTGIDADNVRITGGQEDTDTNSVDGNSGASNTMANAIGGQGFVGLPILETSFIGVPRALQIQPGFTYLVFDTREFIAWARSQGRVNQDFQIPVPDEYKDWSIIGMTLTWKGDLRVGLRAIRPLFGQAQAFDYLGQDFDKIPLWGGNYYKYIRSFTDLCYKITSGANAGKSSCDVEADINNRFVQPIEPTNVSTNNSSTADTSLINDTSSLVYPMTGTVTDVYGSRGGEHRGVDVASASKRAPIFSIQDGRVLRADANAGGTRGGAGVIIDHNNGFQSRYYHLSQVLVSPNEQVKSGQQIGVEGNTGKSTGEHLHLETWQSGQPFNPAEIFPNYRTVGGRSTAGEEP